ncbi:MarR family winged helix-turn-helix transcriptional regulator [Loktanella sp. DJP18]|uniref:MarR family winged helix-turn-helix transcriptional regulator n=1 Tax=Loktanella sp. DJP18 TaxID=3409788 RepID=UPI003BB4ABA5
MTDIPQFQLANFLPYLLNQSAEIVGQDFSRVYRNRYGMLRTEWRVLAHLGQFGTLSATEVGIRARIHKTKISRAVAALEAKRFVRRKEVAADRRIATLSLTKAGQTAYDDLLHIAMDHDRALMELLGVEEHAALFRSLRILAGITV